VYRRGVGARPDAVQGAGQPILGRRPAGEAIGDVLGHPLGIAGTAGVHGAVHRKAIEPNYWNAAWHRALRAAGGRPARDAGFHQLRHHYASTLLAGGVDVRMLADALGHRDPGFTLRVYAHLMPDSADRIRAAIDRAATGPAPAQTAEMPS
jgi:integrase